MPAGRARRQPGTMARTRHARAYLPGSTPGQGAGRTRSRRWRQTAGAFTSAATFTNGAEIGTVRIPVLPVIRSKRIQTYPTSHAGFYVVGPGCVRLSIRDRQPD